jgi:GntR family histidine utilization transcriptional repressor
MALPSYKRIKHDLLERIQRGDLKASDRVPSENELARKYGVSRLTVQRAIRELVAEGLLRRAQGAGTFVTSVPHRFALVEVRDPVQEIRDLGGQPNSEVLMQRRCATSADVEELLDLEAGAEVFQVAILQSFNQEPVAYEERWAVLDVFPDFLQQDFNRTSVFHYFASRSVLEDVETLVAAVHPPPRIAQLLEIAPSEPCIRVQRRNRYRGKWITLTRITYAGSRQVLASRFQPGQRN